VTIAGVDLPVAEQIKVLGVVLDQRLTFEKQATARTDYCNALLHGSPVSTINKEAWIILQSPRRSDVKFMLRRLHWFANQAENRIQDSSAHIQGPDHHNASLPQLSLGLPPIPDLRHAVPRPGKTSPGTPNVPDFKVQSKCQQQ